MGRNAIADVAVMPPISRGWVAQDLINREDIVGVLRNRLSVVAQKVPEGMAGNLYCVGGISDAADDIMDILELRALDKIKKGVVNA